MIRKYCGYWIKILNNIKNVSSYLTKSFNDIKNNCDIYLKLWII